MRMSEEEVFAIFRQICEGVRFLHSNKIIHRDLKPGNILLARDPKTSVIIPKLGDMGLTKELMDQSWAASRKGTPAYLAPEIIIAS